MVILNEPFILSLSFDQLAPPNNVCPICEESNIQQKTMVKTISKKVLYIDDEPYMQLIVKTCLQTIGRWEVEVAKSGAEGLVKAEELKPDAIILDVMMPEMDGVTCLQKLQLNVKTQAIPVIFLTSVWSVTERSQFSALGAVGAIAKPFNPLTLVPQIATVLDWKLDDSNAFS